MSSAARARLRGWSLRRRVGVAFLVMAVVLSALAAVIVVSVVGLVRRGDEVVNRWQPALARSQDLLADLVDQETGVRGYALTGLAGFLDPYQHGVTEQRLDDTALRGYLGNQQALLAQLVGFEHAAAAWQRDVALPLIALARAHDSSAAKVLDNVAANQRFDLVRARAAALTAAVATQSTHARAARQRAQELLYLALAVAGVVVPAAALTLWVGLRRWVLGPVDQLAQQTRQVADGDLNRGISPSGPPEFLALAGDVETMRRRIADELARIEAARAELAEQGEELTRSNADLEQFAYVASHDLSEPLRKVANFCQLLERQYGDRLDDKAKQYIDFAVDGAKRMQNLINDLLSFSRVGRTVEAFTQVDLGDALRRALGDLDAAIAESGAVVEYGSLPAVPGDASLLSALFSNLVGNAVKYRGAAPPRVVVSAVALADGGWLCAVADNGIGIEAQYAERIFAIFQRLHLRDEYAGTGIGLALCRKIVEFHGGRIWLDTEAPGPGARFCFTLAEGTSGGG